MLRRLLHCFKSPREELRTLLKGYELPSFPSAVMGVINLLRDPNSPMSEIVSLIQSDPGMHVMVLKTVNSAAFGLNRKVSNVLHATTLLGRSRLESLVLPLGVRSVAPRLKCDMIDTRTFWLTAAKRACLAEKIAAMVHPATRIEAFTAGLLQDMAIPVMIDVKRQAYCDTLERWFRENSPRLDLLEQQDHGIDHQAVGALMAEEWNLPEYLVKAISRHHIAEGKDRPELAIRLVSSLRYIPKNQQDDQWKDAAAALVDHMEMDPSCAVEIVKEAFENANAFSAIMS